MNFVWMAHMDTIQSGTRGLGLLFSLNWDRILYPATIFLALSAGAWLPLLFGLVK
jgi:hypothetical protein